MDGKEFADLVSRNENGALVSWQQVSHAVPEWHGILIGNGGSIAIWEQFRYASLFEKAFDVSLNHYLVNDDRALFEGFQTFNFETILGALLTTESVLRNLNYDTEFVMNRYSRIRDALVEAVKAVHAEWTRLDETNILTSIRSELKGYSRIYTTNYDLLIYWAIMTERQREFPDYFWSTNRSETDNPVFDPGNTTYDGSFLGAKSYVLYLHGALHLYRLLSGTTVKLTATSYQNLLSQFGNYGDDEGAIPLFVTEGTAKDKFRAIQQSSYLSFAYNQFSNHQGPLVVFGHSLGKSDEHILDAMKSWRNRVLAVSLFRKSDAKDVQSELDRLRHQLPNLRTDIVLFDAETHPLGSSELRLDPL